MTLVRDFKEQFEVGFPMFKKLFELNRNDFITVMKEIFHDNKSVMEILEGSNNITKTIRNDTPEEISVEYYNSISINFLGVYYKPEHEVQTKLINFDKFLNIDAAFDCLNKTEN